MIRDANYELTWKIRRSFKLLAALADTYLAPYGLVAGERAVMEFIDSWGEKSVPELARSFHVSRQNIQVRVNGLIRKGLLEKRANPAHKRSVLIGLSQAGRDMFTAIKNEEESHIRELFGGLSAEDVAVTSRTLSRLMDRIDDTLNAPQSPGETS